MKIINLLDFYLKYYIFGPHTALNALRRYPKYSIIPVLKSFGGVIGDNCDIESGITFHNCTDFSNLKIGNNCHIGKDCFFDLRAKITIEENVVISMKTKLLTHLDLSKSELTKIYPPASAEILIKKNVYIGVDCTVLMGNTIGEFSFAGANSLINKDVAPYKMIAGIPAKVIKNIEYNL